MFSSFSRTRYHRVNELAGWQRSNLFLASCYHAYHDTFLIITRLDSCNSFLIVLIVAGPQPGRFNWRDVNVRSFFIIGRGRISLVLDVSRRRRRRWTKSQELVERNIISRSYGRIFNIYPITVTSWHGFELLTFLTAYLIIARFNNYLRFYIFVRSMI